MSWSTSELRVRLAPLNRFKPSSKIFYWPFQGGTSFVDLLCFCSVLCLLCLCASVYMCFVVTCWERADLLALVCGVFCEFVTFPLVSWVRCGSWLYRFLIFAPLLTLKDSHCETAQFWARYMHMIQMVLTLIRATWKTTLNCMSSLSVRLFPNVHCIWSHNYTQYVLV